MTRDTRHKETAYIPLYLPGHDVPCGEAEIAIYPVAEGAGRQDDVYVIGLDRKSYALNDEKSQYVRELIEREQPKVWNEIRLAGVENSSERAA